MITLHRDDTDQFVASVTIGGSSGTEKLARLILDFGDRKLMFDGSVQNNTVTVEIPMLMDIETESGVATLEMIVDRTFFEAYTSEFVLVNRKSVMVDDVEVSPSKQIEITVEDINLEDDEPMDDEERSVPKVESKVFLDGCSTRNKLTAESFISRYKSTDKLLDEFSDAVRTWATGVFVDPSSQSAKIAMTELTKKIEK